MYGSLLNRMIFGDLVKVFLLSLGSLTGLLLMAVLIQEGSRMGIGMAQLLAIVPLFVPNILPYTIPTTTLFASCVVYGRLAHDNELIAIKAAGVRLYGILKPALLLGLLTTAATAGLYYAVIPRSQQMLQQAALKDPEEVLYNLLKRERCFRYPTFPYVLYVKDVQGKRLIDVVIKKRMRAFDPVTGAEAPASGYDSVAWAREAQLKVDVAHSQMSIFGERFVVYDKNTKGATASDHPIQVPLPDSLSGKEIKSRIPAMTWRDLGARVAELERVRDNRTALWERTREAAEAVPDPSLRARVALEEKHYRYNHEADQRMIRNVAAEFHMRPALAFGCLVFALIGCPVGMWANRADYLSTFVICFLPTVMVYYPLLLAGSNLGKDGKAPIWLGVWMANAVVGTAAVALILRLLRR